MQTSILLIVFLPLLAAIIGGLLLVVFVNAAFIWIAVSGADEVVPSYATEER